MRIIRFLIVVIFSAVAFNSYSQAVATLSLQTDSVSQTISKNIYGMFSEHLGRDIYDGFWVGQNSKIPNKDGIRLDIVNALKAIKVPLMRWPGGCFADQYHWMDGIGPKDKRPQTVNSTWGGVTEDNYFGTHEFMELCDLIGCQAYIAGNVGSGTVKEMSQWVEYLNSPLKSSITKLRKQNGRDKPWHVPFWGVGNESWGCGGNMTPEQYSDMYRRYASFCHDYPGAHLNKVASGPNGNDTHWMEVLMKNIPHNLMWGVSVHYYTIPTGNWGQKGSATQFGEDQYFGTLKRALEIKKVVEDEEAVMDKYDPAKKVAMAVDEWGVWTDVEPGTNPAFLYQQNILRDALAAASTLNIFNNHSDRVRMANLAQTVNVLQSLVLTKGAQMVLTPTYYVFDLYKVHQDAKLIPIQLSSPGYVSGNENLPAVNASASKDSTGAIHISLVNIHPTKAITVRTSLNGAKWNSVSGNILTSEKFNDYNSFENPHKVKLAKFSGVKKENDKLEVTLPAKSVVVLELK
ncbi:MAG: alpha-N-arabinofuranosidase [Ginsengibacter sp.]